jgi:hypothetical protein
MSFITIATENEFHIIHEDFLIFALVITYTIKTKRTNPLKRICPYRKNDVTGILKG